MSFGLQYLASVLNTGDLETLFSKKLVDEDFSPSELEVKGYVLNHHQKYGALPSIDLVEKDTGEELPKAQEVPEYYVDHLKNRTMTKRMNAMVMAVREQLSPSHKNPKKALEIAMQAVIEAQASANRLNLIDLRESLSYVKDEYIKTLKGTDMGILTGWETLDAMMNGLMGGDVMAYVGRPAMGKTFNMLYTMMKAWIDQGKRCLFVSMEMTPLPLIQRAMAIHAGVGLTRLKGAQLDNDDYKKMVTKLEELTVNDVPSWIVDANLAATVDDIWQLCIQLQPDVLFIDGAYLVKHPNPRIGKFEKVSENLESIKARIATELNIPSILSYQFNREATKIKKDEKVSLEHIAYSDTIGQICSVVLGLFEEESVETLDRRKVAILKGRNGEIGEFTIKWDFINMDFREYKEKELKDMEVE